MRLQDNATTYCIARDIGGQKYLMFWPPRCYVVVLMEFKFGGLSTMLHKHLRNEHVCRIKFGGFEKDRQTAKFNSSPNFPAI